ncbi:MAG: hypothetical protein IGR92_09825 [Leptolyngbyaceae cyanobacterium T60_A2020_046]|nr:hypothetical protein [Leptolyngbyaceae cyanobacterium T60_A2020_046]
MRCAIVSRAGQVLAYGHLKLHREVSGDLRLDLHTDGGKHLQGGVVGDDGDLTTASHALAQQFFDVWGMSDLILNVTLR